MGAAVDPSFDFRLLGRFEVVSGGRVVEIGSPKQRLLLAMLLVQRNQAVAIDALAEELWGGHLPASAANSVQSLVSRLRRLLSDGADAAPTIRGRPDAYILEVEPSGVDVERFLDLAARGRRLVASGAAADAAAAFRAAQTLWRGAALVDFADRPFAQLEAARLEEVHCDVVEQLADAELAAGRPEAAVAVLEAHVTAAPFREAAWARLMVALYRSGRQVDALRAYQQVRRRLADELGLEPGLALRHLEQQILTHNPDLEGFEPWVCPLGRPSRIVTGQSHNLPVPVSSFVGRRIELAELEELLPAERLVTLWGPGGVGKTRLALAVGRRVLGRFSDGVWLVDLAPLDAPVLVAPAVMSALGIVSDGVDARAAEPADQLCGYLRGRHLMLVLDNCEHVVEAVARLTHGLLSHCPELCVLATSRELLALSGERVWPVPPLSLPPEDETDPARIGRCDAAALFSERARAAKAGFELSEANAAAVVQICRHLDGNPLALELAAARVRMLGAARLAERLGDRFRILTGGSRAGDPRHHTLQATMDWSWELLSGPEQELLLCLSVFPGSFDLDAAEGVIVSDERRPPGFEVMGLLTRLIDKSLVVPVDDGIEIRYRLLETVRQYAGGKLQAAGQARSVRQRHRDHFLVRISPDQSRPLFAEDGNLVLVHRDWDNFRAALEWSLAEGDVEESIRLAAGIWMYWWWTAHPGGRAWLERVCRLPAPPPIAAHAEVLAGLATISFRPDLMSEALDLACSLGDAELMPWLQLLAANLGDYQSAAPDENLLTSALEGFEAVGDTTGCAWCHHELAWSALAAADAARAKQHLDRSLALIGPQGKRLVLRAHVLAALALTDASLGAAERAAAMAGRALDMARDFPLQGVLAMALTRAAEAAVLSRCWSDAEPLLQELVGLLRKLGARRWLAEALEVTALLLEATDRSEAAARALAAAVRHRQELGEPFGGGLPVLVSALSACQHRLAARPPDLPTDLAFESGALSVEVLRWCLNLFETQSA